MVYSQWKKTIYIELVATALIIGLTLTLVHLVGINLTGTSVNPARSFATALCSLLFEGKTAALAQVWMFFVGPLAGGALAAGLYKTFFRK